MKKFKVGFIVLLLIILWTYVSYADTTILKVSYNKSGKRGDTATVNVYLQNTDRFDSAITSIEGYLNFDENVFEPISIESIENNNGKVQIGNHNNLDLVELSDLSSTSLVNGDNGFYFNSNPISGNDCKIVIDFEKAISENTKLFSINLKVKSNADQKQFAEAIEISGFKVYFEDSTITVIDSAKLAYTVQGDNVPINNTIDDTSNTIGNDVDNKIGNDVGNKTGNDVGNKIGNDVGNDIGNKAGNDVGNDIGNKAGNSVGNEIGNEAGNDIGNKPIDKNKSGNNTPSGAKDDETISDKSLPYTGIRGIIIPLAILLVLAIVVYKKYNNEKID